MYSELECGICYRPYNTGRRCPRELHCKHSFCESCLVALSRPRGGDSGVGRETSIACPLCRQVTSISGDVKMTAVVRVDECIFDRILSAGVLEDARTFDHDADDDVDVDDDDAGDRDVTDIESLPEGPPVEETDSTSGGKFRRSLKRAWKKITGDSGNGAHVMSNDDFRDFIMMWCYRI